ncbi:MULTISPECIES: Lsr2 family protein [Corynebacterium]|uniref:histone-like nucleoid-structuring protein Lsr2 n=1 Tax=Corynebacterium TaxID=1716 RepID=UPI00124C831B|nr:MULTISPECIES: Lsr2 family protein [Corynebacterium]
MARREVTQYFDDLDQTPLEEDAVHIVHFAVEGREYVLDLSAENAAKFRQDMQPYMTAGRAVSTAGRGRRKAAAATGRNNQSREIRKWAQDNGYKVAARGKIPQEVYDAYYEAHAK